ncbi:hypothetical protein [Nioella sp. MMSF_3534]|uniref:capsular polysaccharide export protein, LipB/KpsS family n=1 Tax=Nioella sp. MMSF_3534 TaxID=3046720 RepID=UPI00273DB113|nr:hypothetical protein [Nioella sp. MMSF_3534]
MSETPLRLCAVATSSPGVDVVREIMRQPDSGIEHLVTFGGTDADYKASSLLRMTDARGRRGHVMAGDRFCGAAASFTRAPGFDRILHEAMDSLQRGAAGHAYRSHDLKHPSDYANYVGIVADRLAGILQSERINAVVFFDIPHLFYDIMLYRLARHLGIRTLILRVGYDPATFYSMDRIEDLGRLSPKADPAPPVAIEPGAASDLYYMKGISQEQGPRGRLSGRALGQLAAHVMMQEPSLLVRPLSLARTIRRMWRVARRLPDWRDPFARFFHTDALDYAETLAELEEAPVDLDQRFVYFPLQMQPEMTTAILGGIYRDQALAIEQLAAILPEDVRILVKENPKQNGQYRSPMFFHRLRRIPSVRLLPSHANTHKLTAASECVATISGTAAWEAVTSGKPALLFGVSWMADMPGVHRFDERLDYATLTGGSVDHAALEQAFGQLAAASHDGAVSRWALRHLPEIDPDQNRQAIARTLIALLKGEIATTFVSDAAGRDAG